MNNNIPKTQKELEIWMKQNCANFNSYSINSNSIFEGFGIEVIRGAFTWYYTERGEKRTIKTFQTESEIIEYAYLHIKSDKWAWTHCIGFTSDKTKADELSKVLVNMGISYFKDEIPYYSLHRPVYRIFVLGCDIKKTEFLMEKYYTEK